MTTRTKNFTGHKGRECGDHRTTGRRAWCFDCSEWCYPASPCVRCEIPALRTRLAEAEGLIQRVADLHKARPGAANPLRQLVTDARAFLEGSQEVSE